MKWTTLLAAIVLCLVVSEYFVSWLLAVLVGNYGVIEGWQQAFHFFKIEAYYFSLCFRVIPFVFFAVSMVFLENSKTKYLSVVSWTWLIIMVSFIGFGYWSSQHSLYTDEHTSSTASLDFIFIPFFAIPVGVIAGILGYISASVYQRLK